MAEFQAVILSDAYDSSLEDLSDKGLPRPLLTIANRPLLWYQLLMLEKAGFEDVIIASNGGVESVNAIARYLKIHPTKKLDISLIIVCSSTSKQGSVTFPRNVAKRGKDGSFKMYERWNSPIPPEAYQGSLGISSIAQPGERKADDTDMWEDSGYGQVGTADMLRALSSHLDRDFFCFSDDLITNMFLQPVADMHRAGGATMSIVMEPLPTVPEEESKSSRSKKGKKATANSSEPALSRDAVERTLHLTIPEVKPKGAKGNAQQEQKNSGGKKSKKQSKKRGALENYNAYETIFNRRDGAELPVDVVCGLVPGNTSDGSQWGTGVSALEGQTHRVVMWETQSSHSNENAYLMLHKRIFTQFPAVRVTRARFDLRLYVFSQAVIGYLKEYTHISSLEELVPILVRAQFATLQHQGKLTGGKPMLLSQQQARKQRESDFLQSPAAACPVWLRQFGYQSVPEHVALHSVLAKAQGRKNAKKSDGAKTSIDDSKQTQTQHSNAWVRLNSQSTCCIKCCSCTRGDASQHSADTQEIIRNFRYAARRLADASFMNHMGLEDPVVSGGGSSVCSCSCQTRHTAGAGVGANGNGDGNISNDSSSNNNNNNNNHDGDSNNHSNSNNSNSNNDSNSNNQNSNSNNNDDVNAQGVLAGLESRFDPEAIARDLSHAPKSQRSAGTGGVRVLAHVCHSAFFARRVSSNDDFFHVNRAWGLGAPPTTVPYVPWGAHHQLREKLLTRAAESNPGAMLGDGSFVCSDLQIGKKSSVKRSVVGRDVVLGKGVKLSHCIVMDHVEIEDNCDLKYCVVGARGVIGEKSSLQLCVVSAGAHVNHGARHSNEVLMAGELIFDDSAGGIVFS